MTDARRPDPDEVRAAQPRQSSAAGRRRARVLIPVGILVVFVVIFLIILLVSRAGSHGNDVDSTPNGLPAQVAVTVDG